jgi:hypothetical protein
MSQKKLDLEKAQELLDSGLKRNAVASQLGVHHMTIMREIDRGNLFDDYFPYDDIEDSRHLYQNFEWLWEEDMLEEITRQAFNNYHVLIDRKSEDSKRVGKYVRDMYGGFYEYLAEKSQLELVQFVKVKCSSCNATGSLENWYRSSRKLWGLSHICNSCQNGHAQNWNAKNPEKIFTYNNQRREMSEALPGEYEEEVWWSVRNVYGWKCAFTRSKRVAVDHFIPVAIGHGGTYEANLIPLDFSLNTSKKHYHPSRLYKRHGVSYEAYASVLGYLASLNGLTSSEYELFIDWCFANPRTVDEVKSDQRHSIEIWQEDTGLHFPLPDYAVGGDRLGEKESD